MQAHIITIGDEILVGQTVDTNSTFIAQQLNSIGVSISEIQSVKDEKEHIINTLDTALKTNDLVILTGGLGPTNDDITKKVLAEYFDDELEINPVVLERVEGFFKRFNKKMLEVNRMQALLPKHAKIIENEVGTASGMWFEKNGKVVLSFPGVPFEMKALMIKALPDLKEKFSLGDLYHHTILLQGIGESNLANQLEDWENTIRNKGITVSYLPSIGLVKVRLTGKMEQKDYIDTQLKYIETHFSKYVYGYNDELLEAVVGELLIEKGYTVGTVESCTAGSLATRIVSVPGASRYFQGSILSYSNELKINFVGVDKMAILEHGAVSQEVVEQMASQGVKRLGVDVCISTSGIAGPDGGTAEKPVGTVWVGVAMKDKVWSRKFQFGHKRINNIESTVVFSLNFLRRILIGLSDSPNIYYKKVKNLV